MNRLRVELWFTPIVTANVKGQGGTETVTRRDQKDESGDYIVPAAKGAESVYVQEIIFILNFDFFKLNLLE